MHVAVYVCAYTCVCVRVVVCVRVHVCVRERERDVCVHVYIPWFIYAYVR